jgi:hypothetical protein
MDKAEALRRIDAMPPVVEGQSFAIDRFRPEDAWGVAQLFHTVYGDEYPIDTYYIPERLIAANASGELLSAVVRAENGDVLGHMAFFHGSAPYEGLYETGVGLTHPAYRMTFATIRLSRFLIERVAPLAPMDGFYGEAVCHHLTAQKIAASMEARAVGIELDLMPAATYAKETLLTDRTACAFMFKSCHDRPQRIFEPEVYRKALTLLASDLELRRERATADEPLPESGDTRAREAYFEFAQVLRCTVLELGADFGVRSADVEARSLERGARVVQFFLPMNTPSLGQAVEILRERGYFLAGYAPRWCDGDALFLQKLWKAPDFSSVQLLSEKAREFLELQREEWRRVEAL